MLDIVMTKMPRGRNPKKLHQPANVGRDNLQSMQRMTKIDARVFATMPAGARGLDQKDIEFLALIGREMRPSVHDIQGFARRLSGTRLCAEDKDCIRAILASAEVMLRLVDEILDCPSVKATMPDCDSEKSNPAWSPPNPDGNQMSADTVRAPRPAPLPPSRGEIAKLA